MKRQFRLGTNRGRPRLWLEGAVLAQHGFARGEPFELSVSRACITILRGDARGSTVLPAIHRSQRRVSGKTRKDGTDHPIIDINGSLLDAFVDQDLLLVATPGSIVIRPVK